MDQTSWGVVLRLYSFIMIRPKWYHVLYELVLLENATSAGESAGHGAVLGLRILGFGAYGREGPTP